MNGFILFGLVAGAFVIGAGSAAAHDCTAVEPSSGCGGCSDGEAHRHTYSQGQPGHAAGSVYCESNGGDPPPSDCKVLGIPMPQIVCDGPFKIKKTLHLTD